MKKINKKNMRILYFAYPLWNKIVYLFFILILSIIPIAGFFICLDEGIFLVIGILPIIIFLAISDAYNYKLFCKIIIHQKGLEYKGGGFIWKWLKKKKWFSWDNFEYIVEYYFKKNNLKYLSLSIIDNYNKKHLVLSNNIKDFSCLIELIMKYNSEVKLIDLEKEILKKGIWKSLKGE